MSPGPRRAPRAPRPPPGKPACGAARPHAPETRPCPRRAPRRGHRLTPADDELFQRTHISLLRRDAPHVTSIDSYSSRGFVVNGNRVFGPCALLPQSVLQWNVSPPTPGPGPPHPPLHAAPRTRPLHAGPRTGPCPRRRGEASAGLRPVTCPLPAQVGSHRDITEESLSLFWMLEPPIGKGGKGRGSPSSPEPAAGLVGDPPRPVASP